MNVMAILWNIMATSRPRQTVRRPWMIASGPEGAPEAI
jgi:hypothetical protein